MAPGKWLGLLRDERGMSLIPQAIEESDNGGVNPGRKQVVGEVRVKEIIRTLSIHWRCSCRFVPFGLPGTMSSKGSETRQEQVGVSGLIDGRGRLLRTHWTRPSLCSAMPWRILLEDLHALALLVQPRPRARRAGSGRPVALLPPLPILAPSAARRRHPAISLATNHAAPNKQLATAVPLFLCSADGCQEQERQGG
jgi:hypothetical protein